MYTRVTVRYFLIEANTRHGNDEGQTRLNVLNFASRERNKRPREKGILNHSSRRIHSPASSFVHSHTVCVCVCSRGCFCTHCQ